MNKKTLAIILGLFILVGAAFLLTLKWGSQLSPLENPSPASSGPQAPAIPPAPSVTLTIQKAKGGNSLLVQWANLPGNTTALDIFRTLKSTGSSTLWTTIDIGSGDLGGGSFTINIGTSTLTNYTFSIEAVTNGGGGQNNGTSTIVLWTSSTTVPVVPEPTSTTPGNGSPQNPTSTGNGTPSSTPSSTTPTPSSTQQTTPTSTTGTPSSTPQGTPYYSPELQISGYGSGQSGSFWVQHVDQKIEIGWQSLPPDTTSLAIYRSPNQDGPWSSVLTQENPDVNGSSSIQVVDNTLGDPYYYEMNAIAGSTTIATYGPVYLPPVGQ